MKKILSVLFMLVLAQASVQVATFADEIVDSKGTITPCKIETVAGGLIEYKKDGNLYSFQREKNSLVFNDYVDARVKVDVQKKEIPITRYSGEIISRDFDGVIIRNENGDTHIPWYRVKFIGVYKP